MKRVTITALSCLSLALASCSSLDLGGSVPLPFSDPPSSAALELDLRPLPPRFCIGLDIVPESHPVEPVGK